MHQGNLKLGPDGALVALDFGIMGRIDAYTRRVYAEILIGFLHRDYAPRRRGAFRGRLRARRPRPRRLRPGAALGRRADLRPRRHPHLDGPPARPPLRGHRALRHADPHRADPAAAHHGRRRGRRPQPEPVDEHVGDRPPGRHRLHPLEPRPRRRRPRPRRPPPRVLSRLGPRLPQMAEAAADPRQRRPAAAERKRPPAWIYALGGIAVGAALVALGTLSDRRRRPGLSAAAINTG